MSVVDQARRRAVRLRRTILDSALERWYGTRTAGNVELAELDLDAPERIGYVPCGWMTLRRVLPVRSVGPDDVFVDFGCGKGRVVVQAATYPFRRVVGVELSGSLVTLARDNVEASRRRHRCRDVRLENVDVLEYEIPDDVTVAFFFNPFQGEIFAHVINALVASVDRVPRRLRVVYLFPVEDHVVMATGRFRRLTPTTTDPDGTTRAARGHHVYETVGPAGA